MADNDKLYVMGLGFLWNIAGGDNFKCEKCEYLVYDICLTMKFDTQVS